jgi:MFS family permease
MKTVVDDDGRTPVSRLVLAEGATRLGDAVTAVALPLTAVLVLDVSPAGLAAIGAAQALPILILSLPAGAWVDRQSRRWPILVAADLVRAALLAAVPIAAVFGVLSLPFLAVIAFGAAAAGTFFDVAFAGWVPRLVHGDRLHLANARIELARSASAVSGSAVGGALVAALTAPVALLGDAASFVASAALVSSVRHHEPTWSTTQPSPQSFRRQLAAGLRFVGQQPLVRAVIATAGMNNLARSIAMAVAILYLVDVAQLSAAEIGVAFAIGHTGFLAGAAASRRLSRRFGMGWTMHIGIGLFGPTMLAFALAPPAWAGPAFTLMVFANGFGIAVHNVNQVTVRQVLTPDHLRARVAAVTRLVIFGAIPIGTLAGGLVAEGFGLRAALIVGGVGLLAGNVPYLLARVWRLRSVEHLEPAGEFS